MTIRCDGKSKERTGAHHTAGGQTKRRHPAQKTKEKSAGYRHPAMADSGAGGQWFGAHADWLEDEEKQSKQIKNIAIGMRNI